MNLKKLSTKLGLALVLLVFLAGSTFATDYYVSKTNGDDLNNTGTGDFTNAFATIGKAVTAASDGDVIYIHAGTYNEEGGIGVPAPVVVNGKAISFVAVQLNNATVVVLPQGLEINAAAETVSLATDAASESFLLQDGGGNNALVLTDGALSINGSKVSIDDGSTIERADGTIGAAPTFAGDVHLLYTGWTGGDDLTAGFEIPADLGATGTLTVNGPGGDEVVTFPAALTALDVTVNASNGATFESAVLIEGDLTANGDAVFEAALTMDGGAGVGITVGATGLVDLQAGATVDGDITTIAGGEIMLNATTLTWGSTAAGLTMINGGEILSVTSQTVGDGVLMLSGDQAVNLQGDLPNVTIPAAFENVATVNLAAGIYGTLTIGSANAGALTSAADVTVFGDFLRTDDTDGNVNFTTNNNTLIFDGDDARFDPGETLTLHDVTVQLDAAADILTMDESLRLEGDLDIASGVLAIGTNNVRFLTGPNVFTNTGGYTTATTGFVIFENANAANTMGGAAVFNNLDIRGGATVTLTSDIDFSGIFNMRNGVLELDDFDVTYTDDLVTVPTVNYNTTTGLIQNTDGDANAATGVFDVATDVMYDINYTGDATNDIDIEWVVGANNAPAIRNLSIALDYNAANYTLNMPAATWTGGVFSLYNSAAENNGELALGGAALTLEGSSDHVIRGQVTGGAVVIQGAGATITGSTDDDDLRQVDDLTVDMANASDELTVTNLHAITGDLTNTLGTAVVTLVDAPTDAGALVNDEDAYVTGDVTVTDGSLTLSVPDEAEGDDGTIDEIGGDLLINDGTLILGTDILVAGTTDLGAGAAETGSIELGGYDLTIGDQFTHNGTGDITGDGWLILDYTSGITGQNLVLTTPLEVSYLEINDGGAASTITMITDDLEVTQGLLFTNGTFDVNGLDLTVTGNSVEYEAGALTATGGGNFILNGTTMQLDLNNNFAVAPDVELDATSLSVVDADGNGPYNLTIAADFLWTTGNIALADNDLILQTDFTRADDASTITMGAGYLILDGIGTIDHGLNFSVDNLQITGGAAIFPDEQAWRIEESLILTTNMDPGDDDGTGAGDPQLIFADDATIERQDAAATLDDAVTYENTINLAYTTDVDAPIVTSDEVPTTAGVLKNVTIEEDIQLDRDMKIHGVLKIDNSGGNIGAGDVDVTDGGGEATAATVQIEMAAGATIHLVSGLGTMLNEALVPAGTLNVIYEDVTGTTTDRELGDIDNNDATLGVFTIGDLEVDGAADANDVALHGDLTVNGTLTLSTQGDLDINGNDLYIAGSYDQASTGADIINGGAAAEVWFAGTVDGTIELAEDWTVNSAGYTLGINTTNADVVKTLSGGDLDFATNGETLYLKKGVLATDATSNVVLEHHSDANLDQNSLNSQPTQGYVRTGDSHVAGNVQKYLSVLKGTGLGGAQDDGQLNNAANYDPNIALTRVEFPVGAEPSSPSHYRPYAISFNSLPTAAVTLTINHVDIKPEGDNGMPITTNEGFTITNFSDFYWTLTADRTLQSQVQYDVEARAAGYEDIYSEDEVEDIRFVRRFVGSNDNPWVLQGATGYDNSTDNADVAVSGDKQAVVIAQDAQGAISSQGAIFAYSQNNRAPVWDANGELADGTIAEGDTLTFTYAATDPDVIGQTVSYYVVAPEGATIDAETGEFEWITDYYTAGVVQVKVATTDGTAADTTTANITVTDNNRAPMWTTVPETDTVSVAENVEASLEFVAADNDTDNTLTYSLVAAPAGAAIDAATGTVTYTPAFGDVGSTYDLTVRVDDGAGAVNSTNDTTFVLLVTKTNRAPSFTSTVADTTIDEGETLELAFTATDPDNDDLTFTVEGADGAVIDTTGAFTWAVPYTAAGTHNVIITVTDDGTPNMSAMDTVVVTVGDVNAAPVFTKEFVRDTVFVGDTFEFTYVAEDLDGDALTFSFADEYPDDATLTAVDDTSATFSWTPTVNETAIYLIKVKVSDGTLEDNTTGELLVKVITVDVAGVVTYADGVLPIAGAIVTLAGGASDKVDTTDATGAYTFTGVSAGSYTVSAAKTGNSGGVSAADALAAAKYGNSTTAADSNLTEIEAIAADVNLGGTVNAADALTILRHAVGFTGDDNPAFLADEWYFESNSITVTTSNVTSNFAGIVSGDANSSFTPGLAKETIALAVNNEDLIKIKPNAEFEVPVRVASAVNVGAYTLEIRYDASLMEYVSVAGQGVIANTSEEGVIRLGYADLSGKKAIELEENGVLASLTFKATKAFEKSAETTLTVEKGSEIVNSLVKDANVGLKIGTITVAIPEEFSLYQNYPNPFNPSTTIAYDMPEDGKVTLTVYNTIGQEVAKLVNGVVQEAGSYELKWNASQLATGVYLFRIHVEGAKNHTDVKKMILMK